MVVSLKCLLYNDRIPVLESGEISNVFFSSFKLQTTKLESDQKSCVKGYVDETETDICLSNISNLKNRYITFRSGHLVGEITVQCGVEL